MLICQRTRDRQNSPQDSVNPLFIDKTQTANPMPLEIKLKNLATPQMTLLQNLHLYVPDGVVHTVMGASGSGKSSLLGAVCGTLPENFLFEGEIFLHGTRIDQRPLGQRHVGILFQEDLLFAHMTVAENLLFAVPPGPRLARQACVLQGLQDLEMTNFSNADPATLSGGQRSRVALMRALLAQPRALLLDEPFSKLDTALRARLRHFVFEQVKKRHIPVLLVTHDLSDIADPAHLSLLSPTHAPGLNSPGL